MKEIATYNLHDDRIKYLKQGQTVSSTSSRKVIVEKDKAAVAIGKRKTSLAKVSIKKGIGNITINSRNILDYFPRLEDRNQVLFPLYVTGCLGKFDIFTNVTGGGVTGKLSNVMVLTYVPE